MSLLGLKALDDGIICQSKLVCIEHVVHILLICNGFSWSAP